MTPQQQRAAYNLARGLSDKPSEAFRRDLNQLIRLLRPPPDMATLLDKIGGNDADTARLLGVTRQAVNHWRRGIGRPGPVTAHALSRLVGASVSDITGR